MGLRLPSLGVLLLLSIPCVLPDAIIRSNPYSPDPGYCPNGGYCVPNILCGPNYVESLYDSGAHCYLAPGTPGLCCAQKKTTYKKVGLLKKSPNPPGSKSPFDFDTYTLNHAAKVGIFKVQWVAELEQELTKRKVFVRKNSAAANHFAFFRSKPNARKSADDASNSIFGSQDLAKRFGLTPNQAGFGLTAFSITNTILGDQCPSPNSCDRSYPYRSYNGSCNNLQNPLWGTSGSPFQRTLLPEYSDGVWSPKVAKSGNDLPSARLVSINIVPDVDAPNQLDTHNVMQWGQFVDHDITHTPLFRLQDQNSSGITCCSDDGSVPVSQIVTHPQCFPIDIPSNDPFFQRHKQRCMNFVRSLPGPNQDCTFGYAEQQNQITHFHDGSNVYGSDEEDARELRELRGGLMKTYRSRQSSGGDLLPQEEGELEGEECAIDNKRQYSEDRKCFKAGDSRSNEHTGLTSYHTVWLREHNRIAGGLAFLNPHWDDETLYQEARRILIAEMQHITYNEWLPIILGTDYMDQLDILPLMNRGLSNKYDQAVNPTILNSFAAAAFRFGHTLIQGMMDLVKEVTFDRRTVKILPLSNQFFNPGLIYEPGGLDKFLVGLATQPSQKFDNILTEEVTNRLFQPEDKQFGMDLVALNLQRGRDHGLQGYNAFRELCGFRRAKSFDQLSDFIPSQIVGRLKLIYEDVDDIDLFIGGISESAALGSLLGPTLRCIVGDQFKRLQHGDRFYYDSSSNPAPFTEEQLDQLRKTSLARITCDNGDNIQNMQPFAFKTPSDNNPLVPCDAITIPLLDLLPWQDGHSHPANAPSFPIPIVQPKPRNLAYRQSYYKRAPTQEIKPFIHRGVQTPLHQFNLNLNYGR